MDASEPEPLVRTHTLLAGRGGCDSQCAARLSSKDVDGALGLLGGYDGRTAKLLINGLGKPRLGKTRSID